MKATLYSYLRLAWVAYWVLVAVRVAPMTSADLEMSRAQAFALRLFATMLALGNVRWYLFRSIKLIVARNGERGE